MSWQRLVRKAVVSIIAVTLFGLIFSSLSAQAHPFYQTTKTDTLLARKYLNRGLQFSHKSRYDSSSYYLRRAADLYKKAAIQTESRKVWGLYVYTLENLGLNELDQEKYATAEAQFNQALQIGLAKLGKNHLEISYLYNSLGALYLEKRELDKALTYFEKSLQGKRTHWGPDHPRVAESYINVGAVYKLRGELNKAQAYYQKALAIFLKAYGENHDRVAIAYNELASIHRKRMQFVKAQELFQKAADIEEELHGKNSRKIGVIYTNLALTNMDMGDFENALLYFRKALAIKKKIAGEVSPGVARLYNDMGVCFKRKEDYARSAWYFSQSLKIAKKFLPENHPYVTMLYLNLGVIRGIQRQYDQSLHLLQKALKLKIQSGGEKNSSVARIYSNLGMLYLKKRDFPKSRDYFKRSLKISQSLENSGILIPQNYYNLGLLASEQKNDTRALRNTQKAILVLTPDFSDTGFYSNPTPEQLQPGTLLLDVLKLKARTFQKQFARTQKLADLNAAFETYALGVSFIDQKRKTYQNVGSQLWLGSKTTPIFDGAVKTALTLFEKTGEPRYKEQVFYFTEKNKANVLLRATRDTRAQKFAGIPDSLIQKENRLRTELAYFSLQIQKEEEKAAANGQKVRLLRERQFAANEAYQNFIRQLEEKYPAYYRLKYETRVPTVREVQATLDKHTALLDYYLGDDFWAVSVFTRENFAVKSFPKDSLLESTVKGMVRDIKKIDPQNYQTAAEKLYHLLVQPVQPLFANKTHLIFIPHGVLNRLPFEALVVAPSRGKPFYKLDYLIRHFDVSYYFSATLFLEAQKLQRERRHFDTDFLAFAPVFRQSGALRPNLLAGRAGNPAVPRLNNRSLAGKERKRLASLPNSDLEVRQIVDLFRQRGKKAIGFYEDQAKEGTFKNLDGTYRFLHLATHSFMNRERPDLSGIVFTPPADSGAGEDGILYAGEIYNLRLKTDLLVLSSCESGVGKLVRGEGMLSLTRGFLYAGVGNLVVSLWKVSDRHTRLLMLEFYREQLNGASHSQALRKAKLKLIHNPQTAFPKLWSGFVLIGR